MSRAFHPSAKGSLDGHDRGDVHVVRTLPRGYRVVDHRGERYYRASDGWYRTHSRGYVRVSAPY